MKISAICSGINIFKSYTNKNARLNLIQDTFIKSNNINFKGSSQNPQFDALKVEMTDLIMNGAGFDLKSIERIIQKYSPSTTFDDYKNLPHNNNTHSYTTGYTQQQVSFFVNDRGQLVAKSLPQKIYVVIPNTNDRNGKIIFLDRILHECTHVMQNETSNHLSYEDFYNQYFAKINNPEKAINTLKAANGIYNKVENDALMTLAFGAKDKLGSLPKQVSKFKNDLNSIFMKKKRSSSKTYFINLIENSVKSLGNSVDKQLIIDFIKLKSQNEKEAYQNALNSDKELLSISGYTDFDLRIELYESIISACETLLQNNNQ